MTTKQWVAITRRLTRIEHILWNLLGYGKPIVQAIKDKTVGDKSPLMNDFEKWIDSCPKNVPSIEEIRKITKKIPYSMVKDSLGELEEELKECCKRYAGQYTVDGDKRHYLLNYCPHCKAKLHPDADKQAQKELQEE